ncbi:MAG: hotdog fold thioesterase [Syntrophomonadaceae bacterium]|nr:hotdog fold thioesterase [Syntrophomonadaceae bacterium]
MKVKIDETAIHKTNYDAIKKQVENDPFAKSLGIELTKFEEHVAEATITVQPHMVNAFGTVHGALLYALADHAFSVACNAHGRLTVGLSTTMQFMEAAMPGDTLIARAKEVRRNYRTGFYQIEILKNDVVIAIMEGLAYRKDQYFIEI